MYKVIGSHTRDIIVLYTKHKAIFQIPLYFEKGVTFKSIRFEEHQIIIETLKPAEQTPQHLEGADSLRLATQDDPKIQ